MALVSFDLDGVLQRNPFHKRRTDGVFGHIVRELAPYLGYTDADTARESALQLLLAEQARRMHAGEWVGARDWDDIVATVSGPIGYPGRIDVASLVQQYSQDPRLAYLYPGARVCLDTLVRAGHTLICITNGFRCYQEPVMRTLGIYHHFAALITPDAVGAAKPQEAIFRAGAAYGTSPIHVGDDLLHDIAPAKRLGWNAVCVVQVGHERAVPPPAELSLLPPWDRPAKAVDWIRLRLDRDRRWHRDPVGEAVPDAIVLDLQELPETICRLTTA